jgi:hypothetical protein
MGFRSIAKASRSTSCAVLRGVECDETCRVLRDLCNAQRTSRAMRADCRRERCERVRGLDAWDPMDSIAPRHGSSREPR